VAGSVSSAVLNKIGSGTLRLNSGSLGPATYAGTLNVNGGALQLDGGTAMGDLAAINLSNTAGIGLTISGGSETIGSLSGGGASGGNVTLSTGLGNVYPGSFGWQLVHGNHDSFRRDVAGE
jgi:autotransporter-associated beta strand protein